MIDLSTWADADRCAFLLPARKGDDPVHCGGARWAHEDGAHAFVEPEDDRPRVGASCADPSRKAGA